MKTKKQNIYLKCIFFIGAGEYMIHLYHWLGSSLSNKLTVSHINTKLPESLLFMHNDKPMSYILSRPFFKNQKIGACISDV